MFQAGTRLHNDRYTILQPLGQGGFSQTFEVDDGGTVKVLKVLLEQYPLAVKLFQREFKVLSQLNHPGIPKVETDSYFMVASTDPSQPTHCLVMEHIPGVDLRQWLHHRHHQPLTEELALDWLAQLAEILSQLHQHHCFHRDIKPSNIMLRPDGQLVLIDFGAVREMTETFLEKQADDATRTHLYSRGYTPMEQIQGRAVPESDFFALGRTFVHLLTGYNPQDFSTERGVLLWQSHAPHVSAALADLIDQLMTPFPDDRPGSPAAVAAMVQAVRSQRSNAHAQQGQDQKGQDQKGQDQKSQDQKGQDQSVGDRLSPPHPIPSSQELIEPGNLPILDATRPPDGKGDTTQPFTFKPARPAQSPLVTRPPQSEEPVQSPSSEGDRTEAMSDVVIGTHNRANNRTNSSKSIHTIHPEQMTQSLPLVNPDRLFRRLSQAIPRWQRLWQPWGQTVVYSGVVTASVVGLRLLGVLQSLELQAFDQLMRWRSPEPLDPRIVLVTIDSDDITYQNAQGWVRQGSLADEALAELLAKLQRYQPRLIGLDIYRSSRDLGITPSRDVSFREALSQYDNLIAVCAVGGGDQNHPAIDPPEEVPLEQVGFSNIPYDADGRVRRQLLGMTPDSTCDTSSSLSSQLALRYLNQDNVTVEMEDDVLAVGDRVFPPINQRMGGYQQPEIFSEGGYQLLLNYRSSDPGFAQISLANVLEMGQDSTLANLISDRVVIIGTTDRSYGDYHATPYGTLSGVVIQAHMVSQILATTLDDRPLLWGLPAWADSLWILGWSLLAGALVGVGRSPWHYGSGVMLLVVGLTGISFVLLLQGQWVPLVPATLSIVLITGVMRGLSHQRLSRPRLRG